jgi:hypothetical protein
VRWWRKSPGSCSSLLVCLSLALLSLPTGKSASSTAVSTNTISSVPHPAGGLHPGPAWFIDVAQQAGLRMDNVNGGVESKKYIIETTGSGVAIFDYDNHGWPDIFLVNGNTLHEAKGRSTEPGSHLFHNNHVKSRWHRHQSAPRLQSLRKVIDLCKKCAAVRAISPMMIGGFISDLEAVARSIASRFAGQTATARVSRVEAPIVLSL